MSRHQMIRNLEWGSKARKEEDRLRGNNNSDRRAAIAEQYQGLVDDIEYSAEVETKVERKERLRALGFTVDCW